ncbi:MAG TPA: PocR ligand-binding domain-containing protein [Candidatus Sulfotelmatobacter sp.]|nr:PocR ligand-binding domain-containing protein [Candidatus Sulfotelmatobacter sp.]
MKRTMTVLSGDLKREFQKDLELFKHFLLLLNDTSPIRNVELMWHEEREELDPSKLKFKNRVGTGDALVQLQSAGSPEGNRLSPSTLFCDLVHGFGAHEEETCARSDVPAKQRCRTTGCTQVYSCHVGLTDIAAPVICDGQYLGTLFSGQVLVSPPTTQGFKFVREALAGQEHINFTSLQDAYYRVPVVTQAQVAETVRILELFARYIANSWKRLQLISESQRKQDRELSLDRKELASILLSGEIEDFQELKQLARRAGLQRIPDRVLVLQIEHLGMEDQRPKLPVPTLNRISHVVEDICQNLPNSLATVVRPGEVCVFASHGVRNRNHQRLSLQEMAEGILLKIRSHCPAGVRIGISEEHPQPAELLHAYQEACAALDTGDSTVSFFSGPRPEKAQIADVMTRLLKAFRQGERVSAVLQEFFALAMPTGHSFSEIQQSRALLTWAIEHVALETLSSGLDAVQIKAAKEAATICVLHAPSPFAACEAFRRFADAVSRQMICAFSQREHKIVLAVSRLVEERGAARITIHDLAEAVHLSCGHLSRVFRKTTGTTLEQYLIQQRVELAKRALLDPRLNVAEVAERSGFCNPAYFASVFKKHVKCTPREFASQPHRWEPAMSSPLWPSQAPGVDPGLLRPIQTP